MNKKDLHKNNFGFSLPEDFDFETRKILNRIEIEKEVSGFPILNQIREESKKAFLIPDTFFPGLLSLSYSEKITNKNVIKKNIKIFNVSGVFRKAAVIFFAITVTVLVYYFFKYNNKKILYPFYVYKGRDTCLTLACIEKEELVKELYYEMDAEEMDSYH